MFSLNRIDDCTKRKVMIQEDSNITHVITGSFLIYSNRFVFYDVPHSSYCIICWKLMSYIFHERGCRAQFNF